MIDWKIKKTIEYLVNLNATLPDSDWNDFLSRKAAHDLIVERHRKCIITTITIPAAAVFLLLFLMPMYNNTDKKNMQEITHTHHEQFNNSILYQEQTPVKSSGSFSNPHYRNSYPTKEWDIKTPIENDSTSYIIDTKSIEIDFE